MKREYVVVSVGGSLIVPDEIDTGFIADFRTRILEKVEAGFSFYIITGGGRTARRYQDAGKAVRHDRFSREDLDWLGIHSTRLNAHLFRSIFFEHACPRIIKDPTLPLESNDAIIIGAGWKPGWSTDYCAVLAAKNLGAKKVINLSNIDYVYTDDPRKNPDAQKIENISWPDFRTLIPPEWDPGLSSPFDPVAAREAQELGLEVAIVNGTKLDEFGKYLSGEPFIGTTIS
ncbi:MAG: UMP kinase [Minisyncoccia bacterium]